MLHYEGSLDRSGAGVVIGTISTKYVLKARKSRAKKRMFRWGVAVRPVPPQVRTTVRIGTPETLPISLLP